MERCCSNGGAKNRGVDDVSRSCAKVINYTGYLTPNDRLASRMLTSRHHATCYARAPPARVLNARNADFSLRITKKEIRGIFQRFFLFFFFFLSL